MAVSSFLESGLNLLRFTQPSDDGLELPGVAVRILDMLPEHAGQDYTPRMPKKKTRPKMNAYDWKFIRRPSWEKPEYNLAEVDTACKKDSYAARSVDKHREHTLRHGWTFLGRNPRTVAYIKRRFEEMSESMNRPVRLEIRRAIRNFIKYSNFFLAWTRDRDKPYESRFRIERGKVTGLFSMNPVFMRFRRDKKNRIQDWYQVVEGHNDESLKPSDVVHGAFDREDGFVLGVPYMLPVLDDIQTWRRFEEMMQIMLHKFAFPLYHHQIGTKERDPEEYDDGASEIGEAWAAVAGMAPEGHLVTSYRHNVEVIGAKTEAMDLRPLVDYWEARVMSGLNMSSLDMGRGDRAVRNVGEIISKGLADRCAEYQSEFAEIFTFHILDELLLEGGYELTPENRVFMHFPPIDREAKRAEDTHALALWQGNAISHSEMRFRLGLDAFTQEDWKESYHKKITVPEALIKAVDESSGLGSKSSTTNKSQPSNQSGTKATKTKVTRDSLPAAFTEVINKVTDADLEKGLIDAAYSPVSEALRAGIDEYNKDHATEVYLGTSIVRGFLDDCVVPYIQEKVEEASSRLALRPMMAFCADVLPAAARNYAYARACQIQGKHTHVRWNLTEDACEDCKTLAPMKVRRFTLGQMIPRHPDCVVGLGPASSPQEK